MSRRYFFIGVLSLFSILSVSVASASDTTGDSVITSLRAQILDDTNNVNLIIKAIQADPETLAIYNSSNSKYQTAQDQLDIATTLLKDAQTNLYKATLAYEDASNNFLLAQEYQNGYIHNQLAVRLNEYKIAVQSLKENPSDLTLYYAKSSAYWNFTNTFATEKLARAIFLSQKDNPVSLGESLDAANLRGILAQTKVNNAIDTYEEANNNLYMIMSNTQDIWSQNQLLQSYIDAESILNTDQALLSSIEKENAILY